MLFTSLGFLVLLPLVLGVTWALPTNRLRKLWLLVVSYAFYATWDPRFLALILLSTALDYRVGQRLAAEDRPGRRRALLALSLVGNLGMLGTFKYYGFFLENLEPLLRALSLDPAALRLDLVLPVGISFYTFQTLSYTFDVYRRELAPCTSILDFSLFVAFFPQLVAGPIVRARDFLPQLGLAPRAGRVRWRLAATLFLVGFFKKACLADGLAPLVDQIFEAPHRAGVSSAWLAAALFSLQIYADFSAYSDMAVALAAACGYRLCDNFRFPFLATNSAAAWQRWHMSLTSWLHDYVFVSMGGWKGSGPRVLGHVVLTFLLVGLWHGAGWHYLIWGGLHGLAVATHVAWRAGIRPALGRPPLPAPLAWALTQVFGVLAGVWFRAPSAAEASLLTATMIGGVAASGSDGTLGLPHRTWAVVPAFLLVHLAASSPRWPARIQRLSPVVFLLLLGVGIELCLLLQAPVATPHIYFQF